MLHSIVILLWLLVLAMELKYIHSSDVKSWRWHLLPLLWATAWLLQFIREGQDIRVFSTLVGFLSVGFFLLGPLLRTLIHWRQVSNGARLKEVVIFSFIPLLAAVLFYPQGAAKRIERAKVEELERAKGCIVQHDLNCIGEILSKQPSVDTPLGLGYQQTLLEVAVEQDSLVVAEYLLKHGASPNAAKRAPSIPTIIERAVGHGNMAMVKLLLDKGAGLQTMYSNVSLVEHICWTSPHAISESHIEIAQRILAVMRERGLSLLERERQRCLELLRERRSTPGIPAKSLEILERIVGLLEPEAE